MAKEKKVLTAEQIYKSNKRKSKWLGRIAPIVWLLFLGLAVVFMCFALKNSVGNIFDILHKLDKKVYNDTQIAENYKALVEQWGEWKIIGGDSGGLGVEFVNIENALFSGMAILYTTLAVISFAISIIVGKILLPSLSKHYAETNDSLVDIATLRTNAEITKNQKKEKKEWF